MPILDAEVYKKAAELFVFTFTFNQTWPLDVKVPIPFMIMKSNQVYMLTLGRNRLMAF